MVVFARGLANFVFRPLQLKVGKKGCCSDATREFGLEMGALSKPATAAAIVARACQVRQRRQYIGLWEWVAWGCLHQTPVLCLFGSNLVDLFAVLRTFPKGGCQEK